MSWNYSEPQRCDYDSDEEYEEALEYYNNALEDYCNDYEEWYRERHS